MQRFSDALDRLHDILKRIHLGAFVCLNKKKEELENDIALLYFDVLAHLEFGIGKCHLYDGEIEAAFEHLNQSALFSQLANQPKEALLTQVHLGKLHLYSKNWEAATKQFETIYMLFKEIKEISIPPDCLVGWALALKGNKEEEKGKRIFSEAITLLEHDLKKAPYILENFADFMASSGYAEWALHLYYRALEYAVETKQLEYARKIFKKLYKSIFGTKKNITILTSLLDKLIQLAQELKKQDVKFFFYAEKERLTKLEQLLTQTFPFITPPWKEWESGNELPSVLKYDLELLHIGNIDSNTSLLVSHSPNVGNIGFSIPSRIENNLGYSELKLKDNGYFKIEDAPEPLKKSFFLRAMIKVKEFNDIEFQKFRPLIEFEI